MGWGIPVGANASVRSPGLFAFWGRENLQPPILETFPNFIPPTAAIELAPEHIKRAIFLTHPQNTHADRPCNKISQLQSGGIDLFCGEDDVKRQLNPQSVRPATNPAKLQLKLVILPLASPLENHMR